MKIAIVTGSERGIGRATAKLLSENGFTVVSASVANEGDELVTSLLEELRVRQGPSAAPVSPLGHVAWLSPGRVWCHYFVQTLDSQGRRGSASDT